MNILAIGAHPDDVDLLCGGTLALYAQAGHVVTIAVATDGRVGEQGDDIAATIIRRRAEAEASCAVIGARLIWMGYEDEWLMDDRETRTRFIDAFRESAADIVLAHSVGDYHPDHRTAGKLALDAQIPSAVPRVRTTHPSLPKIPALYTMDTVGQLENDLDVTVDISSVIDIKEQMLRSHASQEDWLEHIYGMAYVDFMRSQAARRGEMSGLQYAESFRQVPTYPPSRPDIPLLGDL
ncbi:PIG-L deacetylase family protein [Herbiconiux sp. A18JL235]|uniref:PIG-L deacetylase family protein n=1 Tax=Herbiconiux sp. A18JL235 TaxID=3152363 RepID=A0AB39BHG0_9MICO